MLSKSERRSLILKLTRLTKSLTQDLEGMHSAILTGKKTDISYMKITLDSYAKDFIESMGLGNEDSLRSNFRLGADADIAKWLQTATHPLRDLLQAIVGIEFSIKKRWGSDKKLSLDSVLDGKMPELLQLEFNRRMTPASTYVFHCFAPYINALSPLRSNASRQFFVPLDPRFAIAVAVAAPTAEHAQTTALPSLEASSGLYPSDQLAPPSSAPEVYLPPVAPSAPAESRKPVSVYSLVERHRRERDVLSADWDAQLKRKSEHLEAESQVKQHLRVTRVMVDDKTREMQRLDHTMHLANEAEVADKADDGASHAIAKKRDMNAFKASLFLEKQRAREAQERLAKAGADLKLMEAELDAVEVGDARSTPAATGPSIS